MMPSISQLHFFQTRKRFRLGCCSARGTLMRCTRLSAEICHAQIRLLLVETHLAITLMYPDVRFDIPVCTRSRRSTELTARIHYGQDSGWCLQVHCQSALTSSWSAWFELNPRRRSPVRGSIGGLHPYTQFILPHSLLRSPKRGESGSGKGVEEWIYLNDTPYINQRSNQSLFNAWSTLNWLMDNSRLSAK